MKCKKNCKKVGMVLSLSSFEVAILPPCGSAPRIEVITCCKVFYFSLQEFSSCFAFKQKKCLLDLSPYGVLSCRLSKKDLSLLIRFFRDYTYDCCGQIKPFLYPTDVYYDELGFELLGRCFCSVIDTLLRSCLDLAVVSDENCNSKK